MKFLHLSQLSMDSEAIVAVRWDLLMTNGCRTTVIYHDIPRLSVVQLYSDNPKYEEDKAKLMTALSDEQKPILSENQFGAIESDKAKNIATDLTELRLGTRLYHDCLRAGFDSVEKLEAASDIEIRKTKNFGQIKLDQIRESIRHYRSIQPYMHK